MSRFFPHAPYAEDQPLARTILTSHVLYRGFQTGAAKAIPVAGIPAFRQAGKGFARSAITASALRTTGAGALIGTALMVPAMVARMWGRESIEWQDRSWRLLANEGQKEGYDLSLLGTAAGALVAMTGAPVTAATRTAAMLPVAGGAGVGTMVGVAGYMVWRYGVHRGERQATSS